MNTYKIDVVQIRRHLDTPAWAVTHRFALFRKRWWGGWTMVESFETLADLLQAYEGMQFDKPDWSKAS